MKNIIEIENLSKDYEKGFFKKKKIRALDSLSLTVAPGQIFGFLGGNGAGKTTTIKILMRLLFPTEGGAKILGQDISDISMHSRIGYCPENPYFYDYLKAFELMMYFAELLGIESSKQRAKCEELLTRVGLQEKDWNRQLRKFSKGMLQRVGIAQSLINDPEIVFFDEPMSGLDPIGRRDIRKLIEELRSRGVTVFMSTHILSDIEALCDNVAILRSGRLSATGNLQDLLVKSGETQSFEIIFKNVSAEILRTGLSGSAGFEIADKPNGASVIVSDEDKIGEVMDAAKSVGGNLVSVQPLKQSLEELFAGSETGDH